MVSLRQLSTIPIVGVVADGQTYRNLIYLLVAIPLGFLYSMMFSVGFVFGLLLSVVLVGLAIFLAMLFGTRLIAAFERWLANGLLKTDLVAYNDVPDDAGGGLASVKKYTDAASTWRGVGFISLKFYTMFFAFIPIFGLASALPLVAAPIRYPYTTSFGEANGEPVTWAITSRPEALAALLIGVVGLIVILHVSNLIAYVNRQMAVALLGESATAEPTKLVSVEHDSTESDSAAVVESVTVDDDASEDVVSEDDPDDDRSDDDTFEYAAVDGENDSDPPERDGDR